MTIGALPEPPIRWTSRALGWTVHVYTASGAVLAMLVVLAVLPLLALRALRSRDTL